MLVPYFLQVMVNIDTLTSHPYTSHPHTSLSSHLYISYLTSHTTPRTPTPHTLTPHTPTPHTSHASPQKPHLTPHPHTATSHTSMPHTSHPHTSHFKPNHLTSQHLTPLYLTPHLTQHTPILIPLHLTPQHLTPLHLTSPTPHTSKKLYALGMRGNIYYWVKSYLTNRSHFVCIIIAMQIWKKNISHGMPQESFLGPLLFIVFMSDFSRASDLLFSILFADDTNVLIEGQNYNNIIFKLNTELQN